MEAAPASAADPWISECDVQWLDGVATIRFARRDFDVEETLRLHGLDIAGAGNIVAAEMGILEARSVASALSVVFDNVSLTFDDAPEVVLPRIVDDARYLTLRPVATELSAEQVMAMLQVDHADLLVWHPKLGHRTRFVPVPAAFPGGIGSRFSHILVRLRPVDGSAWLYSTINVALGMVDCIVPWGSPDGWAMRHAFGHALCRIGWSAIEPVFGIPDPPALPRRPRSAWLEAQLRLAGLTDVRVLEGRHTANAPRSAKGAIGRHLSALADALYDPTTRRSGHTCLVIDERTRGGLPLRQHVRALLQPTFPSDAEAIIGMIFNPRRRQERSA